MDNLDQDIAVEPQMIPRQCGGWLALSPPGARLRIGVTATTEEAARAGFRQALARWAESLRNESTGLSRAADLSR